MKNLLLIGRNSYLARSFTTHYADLFNIYSTSKYPCDDANVLEYNLNDNTLPVLPEVSHAIIFAGKSNIVEIERDRRLAYGLNFQGTCRLIRGLNKVGIKTLFLSSSAVFANSSIVNHEDTIRRPSTYYGHLKKLVEDEILSTDINSIVRISKCFNDNSIISRWSEMLRLNTPIECLDDLLISPVPAFTVSNMIYDWINGETPSITHISSSSHLSYYQLGKLLASHLQRDTDLV